MTRLRTALCMAAAGGMVVAITAVAGPTLADPGDPPITGTVFRDFDADGTRDALEPGFADIAVTAYDSAGASSLGAVAGDGTYSIDISGLDGGADGYRVEFTGLPAYMSPGPVGPDSGTTVQFVGAGGVANVGVMNPADYCGSNPSMATTCFQGGTAAADGPAVVDFVYEAGTTSNTSNATVALTPHPSRATDDQVGPVRGLAYHRSTDVILAAAYAKRHTAYPGGPDDDGPDTIWIVNRDGSAPTPFVTIEAGDDNHDYTDLIDDVGFWNDVGRTGWGDINLSEDESTLYAVNMFDKLVYAIPVTVAGGAPVAGAPTSISLSALTSIDSDCTNGTWVPGAATARDGLVYISATCIADGAGGTQADLQAFVYAYDGAAATQVAQFPLNYDRTYASRSGAGVTAPAEFFPWVAAEPARQGAGLQIAPPAQSLAPFGQSYYPQAWVTDIEFDEGANMLVGVTDRFGDQFGNDNGAGPAGNGEGAAAGDTVRLTPSGATWSLNPITDDDFYNSERYVVSPAATSGHDEISLGHLAVLLGRGEVVTNAFDPAPVGGAVPRPTPPGGSFANSFRSGGIIHMSHADGSRTRSYQIFGLDEPGTFGKASGIGDVELICDSAPIEIGNYVWLDTDRDGVQDPDETPIEGVTVNLYDDVGTLLATVVTTATGEYYFNDATPAAGGGTLTLEPGTDYVIRLDNPADYAAAGPLEGLDVTAADQGSDIADSDAVTTAGFPQIDVTTGGPGENDHTFDVGFAPPFYRIGSLVWEDYDDDGIAEPGEAPIAGVTVELLDDGGNVIDTTTTDGNGEYGFDGLDAGDYSVRIPGGQAALDGLRTSGTPVANADGDADNDNNGVEVGPDWESGAVTLGDGDGLQEPTGEANGITGASNEDGLYADGRSNQTVDFGFHRGLRLGNQVWADNGAGSNNDNGVFDADELPIAGVEVELWLDDGDGVFEPGGDDTLVDTDTTDLEGNYLFEGLDPGSYIVAIDSAPAGLELVPSSPTPAADPESADNDNDGNAGDPSGYLAVSNPVDLSPGGEPSGETDTVPGGEDAEAEANAAGSTYPDTNSNLRVDFGFVAPTLQLGNQLWFDLDNDGVIDNNEPVVPAGVQVNLLDAGGNVIATVETDADGRYLFDDLLPGDYVVEIPSSEFEPGGPLAGFGPSTGPGSSTDPNDGVDDNNDGALAPGGGVRSGPVTLAYGDAPTNEGDPPVGDVPNNSSDLTVDFGFVPSLELGNLVFVDTDNDGVYEPGAGETPIPGVRVVLTDADGNELTSTTTDADGKYLFTGLAPGDYMVRLPASNFRSGGPLEGRHPSSGPGVSDDPNDNVDSNSDGIPQPNGSVKSGIVTLSYGDEPRNEDDESPTGLADRYSNLSVDFGVYSLSLGDTIWCDDDNSGTRDPGEDPVPGVRVNLIDAEGNIVATTTTNANGRYRFDGLAEGDYVVELPASNFVPGGPLDGKISSTGNDDANGAAPDPDDDREDDDNGDQQPDGSIRSLPVSLSAGDEPSNSSGTRNSSVDFGVIPAGSIGSTVFSDTDRDGQRDPDETGIPGVTVTLIDVASNTPIATTTTGPDGTYLFDDLPPGDYVVVFVAPPGTKFTVANSGSDASDSDADPTTGQSPIITLGIGEDRTDVFAGIVPADSTLPRTGSAAWQWLSIATMLLSLGGLIVVMSRRRRPVITA